MSLSSSGFAERIDRIFVQRLVMTLSTRLLVIQRLPTTSLRRSPCRDHIRSIASSKRCYANGFGGPSAPGQVGPQNGEPEESEEPKNVGKERRLSRWGPTLFKMFESAATTVASIVVLG